MWFIPLPAETGICHTMAAHSHQQSLVPGKLLEGGEGMGKSRIIVLNSAPLPSYNHHLLCHLFWAHDPPVHGLGFDNFAA